MKTTDIFLTVLSLLILAAAGILSYATGNAVYTATIIGFTFGFAMQKGKFCGADILSSIVLYRDLKGAIAVLAVIGVSMIGFGVMNSFGWVVLSPKAVNLLPMVVGGFVFGIGTVLGGGCISGSLYKAGEGRLNSMLALLGIGLGALMVKAGALKGFGQTLKASTAKVRLPKSLDLLTGIDYIYWAILVFIIMLIVIIISRKKATDDSESLFHRIFRGKWSVVTSGMVIGVIAWFAYLSSAASGRNYPLGVTGGVAENAAFLTGAQMTIGGWLFIEVLAIIFGSLVSAGLSGDLKLRSADPSTLIVAFIGGVLMGIGAVLAHGCFIGNIVSGWALLSLGSLLAGVFMVLGNWLATVFYLRGIRN